MRTPIVLCLLIASVTSASAQDISPMNAMPKDVGKIAVATLYYGGSYNYSDGTYGVVFFATPNHDPHNYYGRRPFQVGCVFADSDPVLAKLAKWPTTDSRKIGNQGIWPKDDQVVHVKVIGKITKVFPADGSFGVIVNEVRPDAGSVWLSDCKLE